MRQAEITIVWKMSNISRAEDIRAKFPLIEQKKYTNGEIKLLSNEIGGLIIPPAL